MKENKDYYEKMFEHGLERVLEIEIAVLVGIVVCVLLSSCRTVYVPVETVKTEVVERHDSLVMRDSVYLRDSVYVVRSGDTITTYRTSIVYRDRWRERVVHDTLYRLSVQEKAVPVERKVNWWEKSRFRIEGAAYAGIVAGAVWLIWRVRRRRESKG